MKRLVGCAVAGFAMVAVVGCSPPARECDANEQCASGEVCDVANRLCVESPLSLPTAELPAALKNVRYEHALTASGGVPPYTWALTTLPAELMWLSIDAETGVLSGTPTGVSAPLSFDVEVTDASGAVATGSFELGVRVCNEGEVRACYFPSNDACQAGEQTCTNDTLSACSGTGLASTSKDACGANCEPCDSTLADSCVGGHCACGASSACSGDDAACCGGACVSTATDPDNCGGCGTACDTGRAHADRVCNSGSCEYPCETGWGRCGAGANAPGCNTDLFNDINNCGACGNACTLTPGATGVACVLGKCEVTSCSAGAEDCDKQHANGCEVDITADVNNCGACNNACATVKFGLPVCQGGQCKPQCNTGYADCDGVYSNGCEVYTVNDVSNCGACGNVCPQAANATPWCTNSTCTLQCAIAYRDCDTQYASGCEENVSNTVAHCGGCGNNCLAKPNVSTANCNTYTCVVTSCQAGWGDCDNSGTTGCETNTTNTLAHCGACGNNCAAKPNVASTSCTASGCVVNACQPTWGNCDGSGANGCETSLANNQQHCGACGVKCTNGRICDVDGQGQIACVLP